MKRILLFLVTLFFGQNLFGQADLIVVPGSLSVSPNVDVHVGTSVNVSFRVQNIGNVSSGTSITGIYLSPDADPFAIALNSKISMESLAANETSNLIQFEFPIPYTINSSGTFSIIVVLNDDSSIFESDVNNNSAVTQLTINDAPWAVQNIPYPIIFIHGYYSNEDTWDYLISDLKNNFGWSFGGQMDFCLNQDGDLSTSDISTDYHDYTYTNILRPADLFTINFDIDNNGNVHGTTLFEDVESNQSGIVKQGKAVKDAIAHVLQVTGRDKVILVCHSMGGLAAREYLQNLTQPDGEHHVAKLVTIGTPHGGTNIPALNLASIFPLFDGHSEAIRDLRTSYFYSNDSGVFLFGGVEIQDIYHMYDQIGGFNNVDVNCNGQIGDTISGINNSIYYPVDLEYACLIGYGDLLGGDGVVSAISADINNQLNVNADTFMLEKDYINPIHPWHLEIQSRTPYCIKGMDEPNHFSKAYTIYPDQLDYGIISYQSNGNPAQDFDYYKISVPSNQGLRIQVYNIPVAYFQIEIYNASEALIFTVNSNGKSYVDTTINIANGDDYYIVFNAIPSAISEIWKYPYAYKVSYSPLPNLTRDSNDFIFSNNTLNINTTIVNNGAAAAGSSAVQYVLSLHADFSTIDFEVGSQSIPPISAGSYSFQSKAIDLEPFNIPAGTYYVAYLIDYLSEVNESNESDNGYWSLGTITLGGIGSGYGKINAYEYWFDNNYASKVFQSVTPANTFNLNTGISTAGLDNGLHGFHIHFRDNESHWSSVVSEYFHKLPAMASNNNMIIAYEYWFDNDYDSHILQSVTPQQAFTLNASINVNSLASGLHSCHIRYKDENGLWSTVVSEYFHRLNTSIFSNNLISSYRYWFDANDAAMTTVNLSTPISQYDLIYDINTNNLTDGAHTSHFQFKDLRESWSAVLTDTFLKCVPDPLYITANGPTTLCPGNSVTLTCSPSDTYLWSNGATTPSITVNTGGDYFVSKTNVCGSFTSNHILVTTVNQVPANPPAPTYTSTCAGGSLTMTGIPPANEIWYWQGTSCSTNTNLGQGSTFEATSTGTYYIRSRDTSTGCWSNGCGSVVVSTGCPKPSGLVSSNVLNSSATISWTSLPCATSYEYRYRYLLSPGVYSAYTAWFPTVANTVNLTGLTVNTTYQWVVRAICVSNISAATTSAFTTCTPFVYYADTDGDGYGNLANTTLSCSTMPPAGYLSNSQDCNDTAASIHPGATELCNGIDDNCDNVIENVAVCSPPSGLLSTNIYYNAATISWAHVPCTVKYEYRYRRLISTGVYSAYSSWFPVFSNTVNLTDLLPATTYQWVVRSICNNNATSTAIASSFTTCTPVAYYADSDNDGYGNPANSLQGCSATPPASYQTNNGDCNDGVATIYPGAPEFCDGIDNDCDGLITGDEGTTFYQDSDGDGYGNAAITTMSCTTAPTGYVSGASDCNDNLVNTFPGAAELCDGVDNNCDNIVDNVSICPKPTGLIVTDVLMTTATISWTGLPCAVNGYQYRLRTKTGSVWSNYGPWKPAASYTVNLTGLAPVTTYQYQARTKCYGSGVFSTVVNGPQFTTLGSSFLSEGTTGNAGAMIENGYAVNVFPNPNSGKFTITVNSEWNNVPLEIDVTDGLGRLLQTCHLVLGHGVNQQEVDLSAYPDAVYYITLRSEKGNSHYSVVKSE